MAPPSTKASGSHQNTSDYAGTANYAGIVKWAQLDLQSIQHRDYFGHLSILYIKSQPKITQISALASKERSNQKNKGTLLY